MKIGNCAGMAATLLTLPLLAQHYRVAEMNTEQIRALDRSRTVVLLPGGILEEHGPYLPSFTDGYWNQRMTAALADAIVARPGWIALEFPLIPLGTGGANEIGGKFSFPGTYAVRSSTLRSVFLDLATELAEQGFRWIVIVHNHGAPAHSLMLDQACDYFMDEFGGRMVHLAGLMELGADYPEVLRAIPAAQRKENSDSIHAGLIETSTTLFLRPDLVRGDFRAAPALSGTGFPGFVTLSAKQDWPGYLGAPRYGTSSIGALQFENQRRSFVSALMKILDGADPRTLPRYSKGIVEVPGVKEVVANAAAEEQRREARQQSWLRKKGLN